MGGVFLRGGVGDKCVLDAIGGLDAPTIHSVPCGIRGAGVNTIDVELQVPIEVGKVEAARVGSGAEGTSQTPAFLLTPKRC
jgi:hypothetical protein